MRLLGIDTALGACSVAVVDGEKVLAHATQEMQRGHAEALAPMVERVMGETDWSFADLDRLAVTTGPGTFTGQRVGLAFVRAMALALKVPAVGITTLDAMSAAGLNQEPADWAVAAIDARRGEVYFGALARSGALVIAPALSTAKEAAARVFAHSEAFAGEPVLVGTGAPLLHTALGAIGAAARVSKICQPDAVFVAQLGGRASLPSGPPRPLYLRPPDAKLPRATL